MKVSVSRMILAFILALALTIIPLPQALSYFRPSWILLLLLYLLFFFPRYFTLSMVFFLGLLLDILLSTVMGGHVFALSLTMWIAYSKVRRFGLYSSIQQMLAIGFFSFLYEATLVIIDAAQGYKPSFLGILGTVLTSMLFWPWLKILLKSEVKTPNSSGSRSLS